MKVHGLEVPEGDKWFQNVLAATGGEFDAESLKKALEQCERFRTAVDGGAHIGTWTRPLLDRFDRVIAFEPQKENLGCLRSNAPAAEIYDKALSVAKDRFGMSPGPDNSGQWHLSPMFMGNVVDTVPLDDLELDDLDFLKLDVEGWEYPALFGARETLERCKPVVLIEENGLCERYGFKSGEAAEFLKTLGAECVARVNKDYIFKWASMRPRRNAADNGITGGQI